MTRKEKASQTKDRIYASALKVINEKGFDNALIDDITGNAGLAKGSFYNHFQSKEQLLFYTHQLTDQLYAKAYDEAICKTDFLDRLKAFIMLSYSQIERLGKEVVRAACTCFSLEESKAVYSNKNRHLYSSFVGIVDYGKERGVISREYETDFCVEKIIITLVGVDNYWSSIEERRGLAELAIETLLVLVRGFA